MIPGQARFAGGIVCAFFSIIGKLCFYGDLPLQLLIVSQSVSIFSIKNFVILSIHYSSLGSCEAHTKLGPDQFSRFDVYWFQTDRQTPRHPDKQIIYMDTQCNF